MCLSAVLWQATRVALGLNVLFVDDDLVNRKFGARMLNRLQCPFVCVEDGDQVWAPDAHTHTHAQ